MHSFKWGTKFELRSFCVVSFYEFYVRFIQIIVFLYLEDIVLAIFSGTAVRHALLM